jgi:hypothetical protein
VVEVTADRLESHVKKQWGVFGSILVQIFVKLLSGVVAGTPLTHVDHEYEGPHGKYMFLATQSKLMMAGTNPIREWMEAVHCMEWIDSVLGTPDCDGIWQNERCLVIKTQTVKNLLDSHGESLELTNFISRLEGNIATQSYVERWGSERLLSTADDLCWTQLFEACFVGVYRPPGEHHQKPRGKGLRTTFEIMLSLAGIEDQIVYDDGIVLVGFSSALVPISLTDDGSVQWHLVVQESDSRLRSLRDQQGFWECLPEPRLRHTPLESLKGDAYLGWCESVRIRLGNDDMPLPRRSNLPSVANTWVLKQKGIQLGAQSGWPGPLQLSIQIVRNRERHSTICRFPTSERFGNRIDAIYRGRCFIFDDNRKTMWLCPIANLIVCMLKHYLSENDYSVSDPTILTFPDGLENSKCKLKALQIVPIQSGLPDTYGQVIADIIDRYSYAFSRLPVRSCEDTMLGYEFLDILGTESNFRATQLKIKWPIQCWNGLVGSDDIVFCKELGEVIVPSEESRVTVCASRPPKGLNLLVGRRWRTGPVKSYSAQTVGCD